MDKTKLQQYILELEKQNQNLLDSCRELVDGHLELLEELPTHDEKPIAYIVDKDHQLAEIFYSISKFLSDIIKNLKSILEEEKEK